MNPLLIFGIILLIFLIVELTARCIYYSRKMEFGGLQKIKMIFLGRWLINEYSESTLFMEEVAGSLGVDKEYMIRIYAESSGKSPEEICKLFLGRMGEKERYDLAPMIGFLPTPSQNLGYMHTNLSGFRSPERQQKKGRDVKRVILLGGSVSFGYTATSDAATIVYQLEDMLNRSEMDNLGVRWEVINLAVPDFITYQELSYLLKTGLQYEPDIVISLSGYNDAHHYLATGFVNNSASMRCVKNAYTAFFGSSIQRLRAFLGTFFVSVQFAGRIIPTTTAIDDEELSPFIYSIW